MEVKNILLLTLFAIFFVAVAAFLFIYSFTGGEDTTRSCLENSGPVCGEDDVTYPSECAAISKDVTVQYLGECIITTGPGCNLGSGKVCGSDNVTYSNECDALEAEVFEYTAGPCSINEILEDIPDLGIDSYPVQEFDERYNRYETLDATPEEEVEAIESGTEDDGLGEDDF